jgi:cell division protein ZapB
MADNKHLDQITERVERLLLRHAELQRTNTLLQDQVQALQAERDLLKSRLQAARARVDALLDRLPANQPVPPGASANEERS